MEQAERGPQPEDAVRGAHQRSCRDGEEAGPDRTRGGRLSARAASRMQPWCLMRTHSRTQAGGNQATVADGSAGQP